MNRRELTDYRVCRRGQGELSLLYAVNRVNSKKINGSKLGDLWPVLKKQFLEGAKFFRLHALIILIAKILLCYYS